MRTLFLILFIALLLGTASATTRLATPGGVTSGNCTVSACTVTYALTQMNCSTNDVLQLHGNNGIYYEHPTTATNGTDASHVCTIQPFGDGTPTIDASYTNTLSWTADTAGVYKTTATITTWEPGSVIQDGIPIFETTTFRDPRARSNFTIGASQWFYDYTTNILYLRTSDGASPAAHDIVVIAFNRDQPSGSSNFINGLAVGNWWVIDGITVRGAQNNGISGGTNVTIKNSHDLFINWTGTSFASALTVQNSEVGWAMMGNFPRGLCTSWELDQGVYGLLGFDAIDGGGSLTVASGGSGYHVNDVLNVVQAPSAGQSAIGQSPTGGTVTVTSVSGTAISAVSSGNFNGSHYYIGTGVPTTCNSCSGGGTGATLNVVKIRTFTSCTLFGGWGGGLLYPEGSTITSSTIHNNGGEGLISFCSGASCPGVGTITHNEVYDNWSVNIYDDNEPFYVFDSNHSYCHTPPNPATCVGTDQYCWTFNSGGAAEGSDMNKRIIPQGIQITDEDYGQGAHHHDVQVSNNVITNCRSGVAIDGNIGHPYNDHVLHNTITVPSINGINWIGGGFGSDSFNGLWWNGVNASSTTFKVQNNVVYMNTVGNNNGTTNLCIKLDDATLTNIAALDHNTCYHTTNSNPFSYGGSLKTFGTGAGSWFALINPSGLGTGDVNGATGAFDPLLVNPISFTATDLAMSSTSSPAYHVGTATTPAITTDYLGNLFASPPSIGAFEFGSSPASSFTFTGITLGGVAVK